VPEDELQKCQVGKSRVATLFGRGVPILHAQPSALESEAEAATAAASSRLARRRINPPPRSLLIRVTSTLYPELTRSMLDQGRNS
jgi:hypothetical protein